MRGSLFNKIKLLENAELVLIDPVCRVASRGSNGRGGDSCTEEVVDLDVVPTDEGQLLIVGTPHESSVHIANVLDFIHDVVYGSKDHHVAVTLLIWRESEPVL